MIHSRGNSKVREERYNKEFISCKNHPNKRVNKSCWVRRGTRKCAGCKKYRKDGTLYPTNKRLYSTKTNPQRLWLKRSSYRAKKIEFKKL